MHSERLRCCNRETQIEQLLSQVNRQLVEDLQASEGKVAGNNRQKQKLEQTLDEVSDNSERASLHIPDDSFAFSQPESV